MSEINGHKFNLNQLNFSGVQKQNSEIVRENTNSEDTMPQLTDFSDNKAEALGRSMLFKEVDDINNDLKALVENPQIAENSDKIFDTVYNLAVSDGIDNPYEAASVVSTISI